MEKTFMTILVLFACLFCQRIDGKEIGEMVMPFLLNGPSARGLGFGKAYISNTKGSESVYYNPAGLVLLDKIEFTGSHGEMFQDMRYEFLTIGVPLKSSKSVLGAQISYYNFGTQEERNEIGAKTGDFSNNAFVGYLGYGQRLGSVISLGATFKFAKQTLADTANNAFGIDAGLLMELSRGISIASTLNNIGTTIAGFSLPSEWKIGMTVKPSIFELSSDLIVPLHGNMRINAGGEINLFSCLAIRGGYENSRELGDGLSVGFGINAGEWTKDFDIFPKLDYAYIPFGVLGNIHFVTLTIKLDVFNSKVSDKPSKQKTKRKSVIEEEEEEDAFYRNQKSRDSDLDF